ncbi:MAG: stage II sporulation protein R [Bacilli bacterium]
MKKILIFIIFIIAIMFVVKDVTAKEIIVPDEAIRLRILANSNSPHDQYIKQKVREKVEYQMGTILSRTNSIDDARDKLKKSVKPLSNIIEEILEEEKEKIDFDINYGYHYFPSKEYKGIVYNGGYYESLLVIIGKGEGNNWWCVLFPPLCLIEAEEATDVEYKFFVQELIEKIF